MHNEGISDQVKNRRVNSRSLAQIKLCFEEKGKLFSFIPFREQQTVQESKGHGSSRVHWLYN